VEPGELDPDVEFGEPEPGCPFPGTIPTLTLLFAALHDTPPASPGFTATWTSSAFPVVTLDGSPMAITTALVVRTLFTGRGQRPDESLVAKIST
jgi:hypothetical protein